ncbi:hypothetical protein KSS87_022381 [Heliosperma pusillum]|nr:hypothetical protein KSS87_022381 [Heliosperma pusillum]
MAVEHCLQLSTTPNVRATVALNSHKQVGAKCGMPSFQGLKRSFPVLSSSSIATTHLLSAPRQTRKPSIVCKASEAVDQELVLESTIPVLVDFWAPWCGPCKIISPTIDELAKVYGGKIAVFKLNTDESPNVATQYNIRSIPTFLFFKNGERIDSVIGAVPKTTLTDKIDKYLGL